MLLDFEQYYDGSIHQLPYDSGLEETYDYLTWIDMFLDIYARSDEQLEEESDAGKKAFLLRGMEFLKSRRNASVGRAFDPEQGMSLSYIASGFGLSGFSFFCLLLAAAPQMEMKYVYQYRELQAQMGEVRYVTFELASSLYALLADEEELLAMPAGQGAVRRCPLFVIHEEHESESELLVGFSLLPQVSALLRGDLGIPRSLQQFCVETDRSEAPAMIVGTEHLEKLRNYLNGNPRGLIQIAGKHLCGKKSLIANSVIGRPVLFVDFEKLMALSDRDKGKKINDLLTRCVLLDEQLVLVHVNLSEEYQRLTIALLDLCFLYVDRVLITTVDTTGATDLAMTYPFFLMQIPALSVQEAQTAWHYYGDRYALEELIDLDNYADQYGLSVGQIACAFDLAEKSRMYSGQDKITHKGLQEAIRQLMPKEIAKLATKIKVQYEWEDLKIGAEEKKTLQLACARMKYRNRVNQEWGFGQKVLYGRGVSVLLYGPPGTGKTMAAQVMAQELGMDLYRIDLSQMVDKYIGETEKNIGKVFDYAADSNCILFFDEADAIFSKRTDVSNSNDRHANNEIAYLLQKLEQFEGFVILATNIFNNFDNAFIRRLTYIVKMQLPSVETRISMAHGMLPAEAPVDPSFDVERLARNFELGGAELKSVLYGAAFIAMEEKARMSESHLIRSLKYELSKKELVLTEAEVYMRYREEKPTGNVFGS